jgi:hypothetical protein
MRIRNKFAASIVFPISATLVMGFISAAEPAAAGINPALPDKTIAGTVTADGKPISGALVRVSLWPSEAALRKLKFGERVNILSLPAGRTNVSGQYGIDIPWGSLPFGYVASNGVADVELSATDGTQVVRWNVPLLDGGVRVGSIATKSILSGSRRSTDIISFDLGLHSGVGDRNALAVAPLSLKQRTPQGFARVAADHIRRPSGLQAAAVNAGCTVTAGTLLPNLKEQWGRIFAPSWMPTDVTETNSSSHTLGVGTQSSSGVWSVTGTANITAVSSGSVSQSGLWNEYLFNRLIYRDYNNACTGGVKYVTRKPYDTSAKLTDQGAHIIAMPSSWTTCQTRSAGWGFTKSNSQNITLASGMNIGALSVSAQAGWDASTSITWGRIPTGKTAQECGSSLLGPESAQSAEMGLKA